MKREARPVLGVLRWLHISLFMLFAPAEACTVCLGWNQDGPIWGSGFIWSTVFLMGMPFILAGLIGGWLYYTHRRVRRAARGARVAPHVALTPKESGQ